MTAVPHLFTLQEYLALGETEERTELVEGHLIVCASPSPRHNDAMGELYWQLRQQLPPELKVRQDIDIDMAFAPPDKPGSSRRPDLHIVTRATAELVEAEERIVRASELLVVVEIVSSSSKRTDYVRKRHEYEKAGIPHYWIIDISEPPSMIVCFQAGDFGYQDSGEVTGKYEVTQPFHAIIDLEQLTKI